MNLSKNLQYDRLRQITSGLYDLQSVIYSCTKYRHKNSEKGICWNDKSLKIKWGIKNPIISKKDKNNERFKDLF